MQNNGLIKFFTVLFGLVSLYQLSFTFVTSKVESDAKTYAQASVNTDDADYFTLVDIAERNYLDSIAEQKVFGVFNYATAKDRELNKGLDLKGGINVILQVSVKDILKGLAENSHNPLFNQSLARADVLQKSSDDTYVESFFFAFEELKGDENLSNPDIFGNRTLSDDINFNMTDDEVKPVIRRKIDASIVSAFEVLRKRIDKFGVTQPNIQRLGTSGRILVELPGARDVERVKNLLQSTAQLEFWETASNQSFGTFLGQANELLKSVVEAEKEEEEVSEIDDLLSDVAAAQDSITTVVNPIYDYVKGAGYAGGPVLIQVDVKDQPTVESYLNRADVRALLPADLRYTKFLWGIPDEKTNLVDLYVIKANRSNEPPLSRSVIVDAAQTYDQLGAAAVSMQMNGKGARIWEEMTGKAYTDKSNIAIVLDDVVYSAPGVSKGAISGGRSEISGQFSLNEAIDLANVLRAGKLPAAA